MPLLPPSLQNNTAAAAAGALYRDALRSLDPTRPLTGAMSSDWGEGLGTVLDVQARNCEATRYSALATSYKLLATSDKLQRCNVATL